MKSITQEDGYGCGAACVAFVTGKTYNQIVDELGKSKAQEEGFFGKALLNTLKQNKLEYEFRYLKPHLKGKIYQVNTIVFVKRSKRYPAGHYLVRSNNGWMDPWINFGVNKDIRKAESGFRKRLPERPIYALFKK